MTDISESVAPTLVSAELVEVVDDLHVKVRVLWIDNEAREDEFCTNFHFQGTNGMTSTAYASDYGAGTGDKAATIGAPKGQYQLVATTWRWVTYPDGKRISLGSPNSNAIPCDTTGSAPASPGKGQKGQGGKGQDK